MRHYKEYINNIEEYNHIDLVNTSGIIKINIGEDSYITYGNSIVRGLITILIQLENKKGTNRKLQNAYDFQGDDSITMDILEIMDEEGLRDKSFKYIKRLKPSLNYQRGMTGFSEEHKNKLSQCKTGEKHNLAKLTEKEAMEIKDLAVHSSMTSSEIANQFNISPQQVRKIKLGLAWSHIEV